MLAGGAELGLARGKLTSRYWKLASSLALAVSGAAFLVHEQNPWLFQRSAFLHHALGWTLLVGAVFPLVQAFRPRSLVAATGFATTFIVAAVMLFSDRDVAPIFGHLSKLAGIPHR
jgi:peptidoglycan/LPS O-acetylase OafA/YrhL